MTLWTLLRSSLQAAETRASRWHARRFGDAEADSQVPLRASLFSTGQMEQHGRALAEAHVLGRTGTRDRLLRRLDENEAVLLDTCRRLTAVVKARSPIVPAGEWLLDNFYLIEEQIRIARQHLPSGYSRELPRLLQGPSRGLPRVYDIALEAIAQSDGRVDSETLTGFVSAYQTVTPLTLGELWAIPIMLRLAMIENLRRMAARIAAARIHLNLAQDWADQMMEVAENDPKSLIMVIADMARSNPPLVGPFVAELARRLQGHGLALALPLTWIEQRLAEAGLTIEEVVLSENQQQAADQVSISNTIGSLRFLGAMDWREFVEAMSLVEQVLRQDEGEVYGRMDFETRDSYRHVVAHLAKRSRQSESEVARQAIRLAHGAPAPDDGEAATGHAGHVGYYLVDAGLAQLEHAVGARPALLQRARRRLGRIPLALLLASMLVMTGLFSAALLSPLRAGGLGGWRLLLLGALAVLVASQLASVLASWFSTMLMKPRRLPRMDFSLGLPPGVRTLVVVPTLLGSAKNVDDLLETLEVRFLGNQDDRLHFGLLTDLCDAQQETLAGDAALLARARDGIEALNDKYPGRDGDRFYLFHRPRRWNPVEQVWMGYERKRGKLAELNAVLRGAAHERFSLIVGDLGLLSEVRYVITLDTDTQLPRDSARQFVAAMAHPLHQPRFDPARKVVCAGYGILQPCMPASLGGPNQSLYAQLYGSETGIDPYTRSVSDAYQDMFREGSFIGKGIYDVDAFESALKERLPENRILSHDLLEGCHARSGLISDAYLYEEYPSRYQADVDRQMRWIRGDWQIAQWLLPRVPGPRGVRVPNPLSALSRWKIFDNLRRSLVPSSLLLLLLLGWGLAPHAGEWTLAVLGVFLIPPALAAIANAFRRPNDVGRSTHLGVVLRSTLRNFAQAGFRVACLPHEAMFSLRAILRTLWRTLFSHRGLLEWRASGEADFGAASGLPALWRCMWSAPFLAVLVAIGLGLWRTQALSAAAPVLLLWLAAPTIAWWVSRPLVHRKAQLSGAQVLFLRRMARKTWAFFERFVVAEDHWLPPDNFQEHPGPAIAHRTSPTNIGLALLANLSACDFGYLSQGRLLERTGDTFRTLALLERYRGHFYNWYDTVSLQPLPPRYVSSVDSGNLSGHLLTLRAGLYALPDQRVVAARLFEGLADTLAIVAEGQLAGIRVPLARLRELLNEAIDQPAVTLPSAWRCLHQVADWARRLCACFDVAPGNGTEEWARAFLRQCRDAQDELRLFAPWLALPEAPPGLRGFAETVDTPTLRDLAACCAALPAAVDARLAQATTPAEREWLGELRRHAVLGGERAAERIQACEQLARQATGFAEIEYEFLYDRTRRLLAIGYNVDEFRRDNSYYDLLASEARLCSFVAIAQGHLPQESWFALGRLRTSAGGEPILVSWSGSMFEYLMPLLVMPVYAGTLLDQTCRAAVARQVAYGQQRSLPWGVSESGYNTVDAGLNYQYHAFGVPGLGFKRGLGDDLVVAPYASALALMVAPEAACANLQRLAAGGLEGRFGFYEAIDYTSSRLPPNQTSVVVRSFMAHHQGMVLLSVGNLLLDRSMQRRFEADPHFQATLLLLQERIPKSAVLRKQLTENVEGAILHDAGETPTASTPIGPDTRWPAVQLLSNGNYHVMVTNAGGGYSRWKDLALTRWREDVTRDNWGSFVYLRDAASGEFWSAAHQPTLKRADSYEALFSEGRAEWRRRDHGYETYSELVVSPEDDIELRRLRITNSSSSPRTIELTSYAEVVLGLQAADLIHPSFGNLFVQTEIIGDYRAILCTRRPRSNGERTPWMFHLLAGHGTGIDAPSYETDRMRFIGRGRTPAAPLAMTGAVGPLSGSEGSVLDPVLAIRCSLVLEAEQSATVNLVSGVAESRAACLALIEKYRDRHLAERVFDLAWTHSGVTLRQINAGETDAQLYRRLAGSVLYAHASLRAEAGVLLQNRRGQSGLWGYAISGDLPIVLLKIADTGHVELARQMIQCHAYWRLKGLSVDLVIWNEGHTDYRQSLQDQVMGMIATGTEAHAIDRPGGIYVRSAEQISSEDRILLQAVARVVIAGNGGPLAEQIRGRAAADKPMPRLAVMRSPRAEPPAAREAPRADLLFGNGLGGFSADGREYVITTTPTHGTPMPWVNVLANPGFGSVVSECGSGYTWSENAHELRLTPWSDDPVGASGGEAFYLRDEESGHFWSPTPWPRGGAGPYVIRHGFGYSVFEHAEGGVQSELSVYVDIEEAIKFSVLTVRNRSGRARRLSATGYVEWVLGDLRSKSAMHVVTEVDAVSGALFARNAYSTEFAGRAAFFDVDDIARSLTGDRAEFLGRNGSPASPAAMSRVRLSGKVGAALDPCAAIQVPFELADGEERRIVFRLGAGRNRELAGRLALKMRSAGTARTALTRVLEYWRRTLGAVQVETPDPALNVLANGWLVYQTLACRLWARSGYYQSGGAFGFRDQLQDVMALVHTEPKLVREHLLRCAGRQYPEGDVQHWWHPPVGRGVRTRCSDDYLWLPLAVCRYVRTSGDTAVLGELVQFLEGRALGPDEESHYDLPGRSAEAASLYQHCVRAIQHGLRFGAHGLPLMGSGDWNDGMNLVGIGGKGESVWLGFFLHEVLSGFSVLARRHGDTDFAERCASEAAGLRARLAEHAWDGAWYRRAWFDDGTPLGSAQNAECSIDSISQSWSVLSGAGEPGRSRMAMQSLDRRLVRRDHGLIQLLDPPFDSSALDPGYIRGYVPGVRENGGQYTHAAVWAAMAYAALGDGRRAWELMDLINPVNHARSAQAVAVYKTEPYALAADIYALSPHVGRGGWTWYTGSAGWLYRLILESLLGLKLEDGRLRFAPCLPAEWTGYTIDYRHGGTGYRIAVEQRAYAGDAVVPAALRVSLDGEPQPGNAVPLVDDGLEHRVEVIVAAGPPTGADDEDDAVVSAQGVPA